MMHPRDQWFHVFSFTPGQPAIIVDPKTKEVKGIGWKVPPKWEQGSDVAHVHHPDYYHPDPRVRIAHHQEVLKRGVKVAACGFEHDPRLAFVSEEAAAKPCAKCKAVTDGARAEHEKALADLQAAAQAAKETKKEDGP